MTEADREDFRGYLRNITDAQVRGCYEKEKAANRKGYVKLCHEEAERRGISLD